MKDTKETAPSAVVVQRPAYVGPRNYSRHLTLGAAVSIIMLPPDSVHTNRIRALMEQCLAEHPMIYMDDDIKGGLPHIRGTRITVQSILDRLAIHGTVKKLTNLFPHISEAQIKDAVAYAGDFMEKACGLLEADDR